MQPVSREKRSYRTHTGMIMLHTPPLTSDTPGDPADYEGSCPDHDYYLACPDHGCPWCFLDAYGRGECETCDDLTKPWTPPGLCPRGEDCPICPDCGVPGRPITGVVTCACAAELCPQCWRCPVHSLRRVDTSEGDCTTCADRFADLGRQRCRGHGWVTPCFAHENCPDRWEEYGSRSWDDPACDLRPSRELVSPSCCYCQGQGPCKYCHPHCPCCWAERVLFHQVEPEFWREPPACASCELIIRGDPQLSDTVLSNLSLRRRLADVRDEY
jgi:hypothetical protein